MVADDEISARMRKGFIFAGVKLMTLLMINRDNQI